MWCRKTLIPGTSLRMCPKVCAQRRFGGNLSDLEDFGLFNENTTLNRSCHSDWIGVNFKVIYKKHVISGKSSSNQRFFPALELVPNESNT